ncbi:MAG: sodium:solute symporter family protein [Dehalococcoidia bacterium]|jgi:SSS family solute:Na+ symporter
MLDGFIIGFYFLLMLAIGVYSFKKKEAAGSSGFFVAGRKAGIFLVAGSLAATFIGASIVLGMVGRGYRMGLPAVWWLLVGAIGLVILGLFLAKRVRRVGVYTLPELVEKQYGGKAGLAASLVIVVAWISICAAQIVAAGTVMRVLLPTWDINALMAICAAVFVIYTVLGGQYSVIRTDLLQLIIVIVGIGVTLGLVMHEVGGIGGLKDSLPSGYFSFPVNDSPGPVPAPFGWYDWIVLLVLTGSVYVVGPDMYSRLFCARDEKVAKKSAFTAALVAVPIAFIVVLIGMGARVLYPDLASSENAFPAIIQNLLPAGVSGLVIAALLAAIMSSADTLLLTTSTIFGVDICGKISPRIDERRQLLISKAGVVIIGILAFFVATRSTGIINSLYNSYYIFTSGIVIPVVAGFYKDKLKVNSWGALAAIVGGGGTALGIKLAGNMTLADGTLIKNAHLDLVGFCVCAILLFSVSWLTGGMKNKKWKSHGSDIPVSK